MSDAVCMCMDFELWKKNRYVIIVHYFFLIIIR
jgi:hypothetical protein